MRLAQRLKFHVLFIEPKNSTFKNRPSKGRSGTSELNFDLGLTGINSRKFPRNPRKCLLNRAQRPVKDKLKLKVQMKTEISMWTIFLLRDSEF